MDKNEIEKLKKFKEELPVFQYKRKIINLLRHSRVLIISGETGSGKTTQIPQYLYESKLCLYNNFIINK